MPVVIPGSNNDYLSLVDGSGGVPLTRLPKKTEHAGVAATLLSFDGLAYPRAYYGENRDNTWDVAYRSISADGDQWAALLALLYAGTPLLWRDVHGNSIYCAVVGMERQPMLPMPASSSVVDFRFTLARVTYP